MSKLGNTYVIIDIGTPKTRMDRLIETFIADPFNYGEKFLAQNYLDDDMTWIIKLYIQ